MPSLDRAEVRTPEAEFDAHVSLMSLPFIFGTTLENIPADVPYLSVAPEAMSEAPQMKAAPGRMNVGLVWAGGPFEGQINLRRIDRRRSIGLARMADLLDTADTIRFHSLQMGAAAMAELDALQLRGRIADPMAGVRDFMDTAAIVNQLDLVITVDTSVAHLAGALGRPVWILSRYDACWRWLGNREDSPWYPTARIFGQPSPGDWSSVIARVRAALSEEAARRMGHDGGMPYKGPC